MPFGEVQQVSNRNLWTAAFYCGGCYSGVVAELHSISRRAPSQFSGVVDGNNELVVARVYPETDETKAPEYLPANIESFYLQSAGSLQAKNYDASAMMARRALESAVKKILPEGSGTLYERIEQLEKHHKITPELKDWAHAIRGDGNIASHDEEPVTPEFAAELLAYVEMFLLYTITMPAMIENRRGDPDEGST
jgi:hypothetical protein